MPTLNIVHVHMGYEGYVSWSVENHTPENVLDHLEREAFYGVGTAMAMGEQPTGFAIEFQQNQLAGKFPPAARFFFAAGMMMADFSITQGAICIWGACSSNQNRG